MWTVRGWRRLRYGAPIIVVSGLPRSGTSMMMQMLAAGGLPIVSDGLRSADASNPAGYFELEAVKDLDKSTDLRWLRTARGRGVKIVSPLLEYLPETHNYKVVFMERPLTEVIASQDAMLARRGGSDAVGPGDANLITQYETHLRRVHGLLARRACFETLTVRYEEAIANPNRVASQVAELVGGLNVAAMAAAVNASLHRQRQSTSPSADPNRR
jgi:hypothetical protein